MDELCTACLCAGRNLYFIGETGSYNLYSQILNEIPVYDFSDVYVRVCWECRSLLRRFGEFKTLVKRSYSKLLHQLHQNTPPSLKLLACEPHLSVINQPPLSYPDINGDVIVPKSEFVMETEVKVENVSLNSNGNREVDIMNNDEIDKMFVTSVIVKKQKKNAKNTIKEKVTKKVKTKIKPKKTTVKTKSSKTKVEKTSIIPPDSFNDDNCDDGLDRDSDLCDNVTEVPVKEESEVVTENEAVEQLPKVKLKEDKMELATGEKPKCIECGKVFSSKKTYRYHLNTLHRGQNHFPCPRCGKVFQWKSNLGRHMRSHKALDSGELYCAACDKKFASIATYRQHLRLSKNHVSENEFSFICNECGRRFVSKTRLRDHVDWEHLQKVKFRCQLCNKPFKCRTSLYVHMKNVHRGNKKENLCHICGKSYQVAAKLKYHIIAMHSRETPYRCGICHAAFGWYSSLYRHNKEVHQKIKLPIRKPKRRDANLEPILSLPQ